MKGIKWFLIFILPFIAIGCSPSEKNIEKAVAKGDYQYIENYIANAGYWDNPNQATTNAAAAEALILLNRIDTAASLYKANKGKPKEEMIVNAFVNALAKRKQEKMPEKLVELIDDDRNNNSDTLLRKISIEIEPAIAVTKIIAYIKLSKENRNMDVNSAIAYIDKAILWNNQDIIEPPLKNLYSEWETLVSQLRALEVDESHIRTLKEEIAEHRAEVDNIMVKAIAAGMIGDYYQRQRRAEELQKEYDNEKEIVNEKLKELDALPRIVNIKKAISEIKAKTAAKLNDVEVAESQFIEKLNAANK